MNFAASVAEENGLPMTVLPAGDLFYPVRDAGHAPEAMYFAPPQIASKDRPAQWQPMESVYVEGSDALVFFRRLVAELPEVAESNRLGAINEDLILIVSHNVSLFIVFVG